jgi:hypothetical protein
MGQLKITKIAKTKLPRDGRRAMAKTKVSARDIIALSKKEGFLAKQLYVVFTTPTNGIEPVMRNPGKVMAWS